jgi:hypothetical protein
MGKLFGGAPKPRPPARMPDPEDPAIKAAEDRTRRQAMSRSGRNSTILASGGGSGGSTAYKNSLLGQS